MKRLLLATILLACIVQDATACNRCGLFGRRCRFRSHVSHGFVYDAQAYSAPTTINIANVYPQGDTQYGVAAFAPLYATNPALAITASQRAIDGGTAALTAAIEGAVANNNKIAELAKIQALTQHLKAGMATSSSQQAMSLKITQSSEGIVVEQLGAGGKPAKQDPPPGPAVRGSLLQAKCASCHGKDKPTPAGKNGGVYIDAGIPLKSKTAMRVMGMLEGKNVPEPMKDVISSLSDADKKKIRLEVVQLWKDEVVSLPTQGAPNTSGLVLEASTQHELERKLGLKKGSLKPPIVPGTMVQKER